MKEIQLSQGYVTRVDDEDYEWLILHKWQITDNKGYARRSIRRNKKHTGLLMHRAIMNAPDDLLVDHIDGDGLNNQKSNLRLCTKSQNLQHHISVWGKIPFIGVTEKREKFQARIIVNKKTISLGSYFTPEEAAVAYNNAAIKYFGEFAGLNVFP